MIPYTEYEKLISANEGWEDVSYAPSKDDDVTVPDPVVSIMIDKDTSLLAAWRIYHGMSQYEVARMLIQFNLLYLRGKRQNVHRNVQEKSLRSL